LSAYPFILYSSFIIIGNIEKQWSFVYLRQRKTQIGEKRTAHTGAVVGYLAAPSKIYKNDTHSTPLET